MTTFNQDWSDWVTALGNMFHKSSMVALCTAVDDTGGDVVTTQRINEVPIANPEPRTEGPYHWWGDRFNADPPTAFDGLVAEAAKELGILPPSLFAALITKTMTFKEEALRVTVERIHLHRQVKYLEGIIEEQQSTIYLLEAGGDGKIR